MDFYDSDEDEAVSAALHQCSEGLLSTPCMWSCRGGA